MFNENGIGQKNLNNGLLLIIATEEKKLRIITGKGMEIKYSEMVCREIVEKHLRPLLNEGKYEEMIKEWEKIIVDSTKIRVPTETSKSKVDQLIRGLILILIFILPVIATEDFGGWIVYSMLVIAFIFFLTGIRKINTKQ